MRSWLRHCGTSRKMAGSIPDEVIGFYNWPNSSSRIMALESTQEWAQRIYCFSLKNRQHTKYLQKQLHEKLRIHTVSVHL
jgi:hypothetical protein